MRLAVYHNLPSGGAHRSVLGFCEELGRRHEIAIFTLGSADQEMLRDEDLGFPVTRLDFRWQPPRRGRLYLNDWRRRANLAALDRANREAATMIDGRGYNVVLVDGCRFTFAPQILQYLRTPSIYYMHHRPRQINERHMPPPLSPYQKLRRLWHWPLEDAWDRSLWRVETKSMSRARTICVNSDYIRAELFRTHGLRGRVCPPGTAQQHGAPAPKGDYVLSVGELEARKGFDFIVDALAQLPAGRRPRLRVVANGGNPRVRALLEARARRLNVDLTVVVSPSQMELAQHYQAARVFLYGAHEEPLGLAPLEAMAFGVPVVAVAEGGVPETVVHGETGYLAPRDAREFSWRLSQLLISSTLQAAMGAAARSHIERNWTWPRRAAALDEELVQVAGAAGSIAVPA